MNKSYIIAAVIAVIAFIWVLSGVFKSEDSAQASVNGGAEKQIVDVRVRELTAELVAADVIVTGRAQAERSVQLKAETEGQIIDVVHEKGAMVTTDQIIAKIEIRDREARLSEAKERLAQRKIEYNAASALETKGFNSRVRLAQAKADLEAAQAALTLTEIDLANTDIKAPYDGVIHDQYIEIGDYVAVGDPLFAVIDLDPIEITGFVTEGQLREVLPNAKAKISFVNGEMLEGQVSYIAPAADPDTRTFAVEIKAANPALIIREGMTAEIEISTPEKKAHKISPSVLSLDDNGKVGVKIVGDDNLVAFVPIKILSDKADYMWVGGLPEKSRVITVGQDFVVDGQKVNPVQAEGDGLL